MAKTLLGLSADDCRYPLTPRSFCAQPRVAPYPYCLHHISLCYLPVRSTRRKSPLSIPFDPVKDTADALIGAVSDEGLPPLEPHPDLVEAMTGDDR